MTFRVVVPPWLSCLDISTPSTFAKPSIIPLWSLGSETTYHVARKSGFMFRIADQENTFDSVECVAGETTPHSVHSCGSTLGVSFEDEALIRVAGQRSLDVVDYLVDSASLISTGRSSSRDTHIASSRGRVLICTCWIDSVILTRKISMS